VRRRLIWLIRGVLMIAIAGCAEERERVDGGPAEGRVHPAGILDRTSDAFHGKELARRDYSFSLCATCHGDDLNGGKSKVSCNGCHREGPTACATCHRDGPTTNAHVTHRVTGKLACTECHVVPASWDAEGHILRGGKTDPAPAEVTFGARAGATAAFDGDRCTNVACHGAKLVAGGGTLTSPRWSDSGHAGSCTSCHGAPPPSHAQDQCASCHPSSAPHIDGIVQISSGCDGCHGSAASPAPPRDLTGNMLTTALGVGAHQAHLGSSALRGPIACATCHQVPTAVTSAGHIDSPLPAEVAPSLGWDRTTATCTTAWCHGSSRPVWTQQGQATCGSCHGIPPASHAPSLPLSACASCHSRSVTPQGSFLFVNGVTQHLDGDVDVD
jgi:predicted CxxxxCH...CXXCH cytochrome family protein